MNSANPVDAALIDLTCESCCRTAYDTRDPALRRKLVVALGHHFDQKPRHVCRRCRLVKFALQVERWIEDPWEARECLTPEEYALLFESKVKELHQVVVND